MDILRSIVPVVMLIGTLSVTGCSADSSEIATPPAAAPTPVASITQGPHTPSPRESHRVAKPTHHVTPRTPTTRAVGPTCGAPTNPYSLNLCGRGNQVYNPSADVCTYFACIPNFSNGHGYMVQCKDGMFSMSGGRPGTCSHHNGEGRAVLRG